MRQGRTADIKKYALLTLAGLAVSVIPPVLCILSYFPLWVERRDASALSGAALIMLLLAAIPLMKYLKRALRSPASYMLWLGAFIIFLTLSRIADEMTVISFTGFISNLCGAVFFRLGRRYKSPGGAADEGQL